MSTTPKTVRQMVEEITQAKRDQEAEGKRLAEADQQLQALTLWTVTDLVEAIAHGRVHIAPGHDPALTAPTTAQEALDLAWELAHPVEEGQTIPSGADYLFRHGLGYNLEVQLGDRKIDSLDAGIFRTLDPLPDPLPDWTKAPAVLARVKGWVSCANPQAFTRGGEDGHDWWLNLQLYKWSDLEEVTPLYPKGTNK